MRAATAARRLTAVATVAGALVLTTGVAAHAQASTIKDRASDVVSYQASLTDDAAQPQETVLDYRHSIASGVDIRTMRVRHGAKTVSVNLKFAELRRDATAVIAFRVDGESEPGRLLVNTKKRTGTIRDEKGKKICNVPLTTRTGPKGTIRAVIPRSCLGDPERIKVAAISVAIRSDDTTVTIRQDVLSAKNLSIPTWTKWLKAD